MVGRDRNLHGGLHVKPVALRARELRPAWAPPRQRSGPLAVALGARAPLGGGRFKRLMRGDPGERGGWELGEPRVGRGQQRSHTVACP